MATITSRDFDRDVAAAMHRASTEPVIITEHGKPAFVLMSAEEFTRLSAPRASVVDALRMTDDMPFEAPRADLAGRTPVL